MRNSELIFTGSLLFLLTLSSGYAEEVMFQDNFDEGILSSTWEWLDPKDDSTLTFSRPGWLEIKAMSGNDLQPKSNLNAPRLLYAETVSGDFAMESRISAPGNGGFQSGGLLIWKDEDNFLRFERGTWGGIRSSCRKGNRAYSAMWPISSSERTRHTSAWSAVKAATRP